MLTKTQKKEQVAAGIEELTKASSLVFADFTGVSTADIRALKNILKKVGAGYKVFKKRLLKIAAKRADVVVDIDKFESQLGTVFSDKTIYDTAGVVYKFAKDLFKVAKKDFKILGAYDVKEKKFFDAAQFAVIAKLPSREVLLAQIAIMLTVPTKKLMIALNSRKEQLEVKAG